MAISRRVCMLALLSVLSLGNGLAEGALAADVTTIQVTDMHCANCARKIAGKLIAVPGVLKIQTNVSAHKATITPQQSKQPSPKAIWEAVEKAGFKPVKLEGPAGSFTEKPKE